MQVWIVRYVMHDDTWHLSVLFFLEVAVGVLKYLTFFLSIVWSLCSKMLGVIVYYLAKHIPTDEWCLINACCVDSELPGWKISNMLDSELIDVYDVLMLLGNLEHGCQGFSPLGMRAGKLRIDKTGSKQFCFSPPKLVRLYERCFYDLL